MCHLGEVANSTSRSAVTEAAARVSPAPHAAAAAPDRCRTGSKTVHSNDGPNANGSRRCASAGGERDARRTPVTASTRASGIRRALSTEHVRTVRRARLRFEHRHGRQDAAGTPPPRSGATLRRTLHECEPQCLALPHLATAVRGHSGGISDPEGRNVCVIDSLCQLLDAQGRAGLNPSDAETAIRQAAWVRQLCGLTADETIHIADAWVILIANRFDPGVPRPMLLELPIIESSAGLVQGNHAILHATSGPWNGRVYAVCTGHGHTEPIWWNQEGSLRPFIQPSQDQCLQQVAAVHRFRNAALAAIQLGLCAICEIRRGSDDTIHPLRRWAESHQIAISRTCFPTLRTHSLWAVPYINAATVADGDATLGRRVVFGSCIIVHGTSVSHASRADGLPLFDFEAHIATTEGCPTVLLIHEHSLVFAFAHHSQSVARLTRVGSNAADPGRAIA